MNGEDAQLSIVLELVDNASKQLAAAQTEISKFSEATATGVAKANAEASGLVIKYWNEAAAGSQQAADATMKSWAQASRYTQSEVDSLTARFATDTEKIVLDAQLAGEKWAEGLTVGVKGGVASAEESLAGLDASMKKVGKSTDGFFDYFRYTMGASLAGSASTSLLGGLGKVVAAAQAGTGNLQIQQITDEIAKQEAAIATQKASLTNMKGNDAAKEAAQRQAVAASIAAETTKIEQLKIQLAPLLAQQKAAGDAAEKYSAAVEKLNTDWQQFLATAGRPLLENTATFLGYVDKVIEKLTVWTSEHPKLAEAILITVGGLGALFFILSKVLYAIAAFKIAEMLLGLKEGVTVFSLFGTTVAAVGRTVATFAASSAGVWSIGIAALAVAMYEVYTKARDMQQAMNDAQTAGTNLLNLTSGKQFQDLIGNATGSEKTKLLNIQQQNFATGLNAQAIANRYSGIGGSLTSITDFLGLTKMATGGIVNSPTLALVGEAGPEAVIPLSAFAGGSSLGGRGGGSTTGITVNIMGGYYLDRSAATQIGNALSAQIIKSLRTRNYAT